MVSRLVSRMLHSGLREPISSSSLVRLRVAGAWEKIGVVKPVTVVWGGKMAVSR